VGAALLATSAVIEVARAWTNAPHTGAEAAQVVGGIVVALLIVAAFALATRARAFAHASTAAGFVLVAHGGTLVLEGQIIGALFLGLAPVVALLAHVAFAPNAADQHAAAASARMLALWMKKSRRIAPTAPPVASPIPLAMRASQATIIDA